MAVCQATGSLGGTPRGVGGRSGRGRASPCARPPTHRLPTGRAGPKGALKFFEFLTLHNREFGYFYTMHQHLMFSLCHYGHFGQFGQFGKFLAHLTALLGLVRMVPYKY